MESLAHGLNAFPGGCAVVAGAAVLYRSVLAEAPVLAVVASLLGASISTVAAALLGRRVF